MQDDSYFIVYRYMVSDLKLKGAERDIFAIINGFCQSKERCFYGSLKYLSEMTGYTKFAIQKALKKLAEKQLINKFVSFENNVRCCKYTINKEVCNKVAQGMQQSCTGYATKLPEGIQQSCTNNKEDNKYDKKTSFTAQQFAEMWNIWVENYNLDVAPVPKPKELDADRIKKFNLRQKHFAKQGADKRVFWEGLLYAVANTRNGYYVSKAVGTDWTIEFDWLLKNDERIRKFLEAV